jgi:hypothetical protein
MSTALALKSLENQSTTQLIEINLSGSTGDAFFKPVDTNDLVGLFSDYHNEKLSLTNLCQFMEQNNHQAFNRLVAANLSDPVASSSLFELKGGLTYLNALYWEKALKLTDVKEHMSAKTKKQWNEQIEKRETPDFEESAVITTLKELLVSRDKFLAETVDDIFQSLSGSHVTNQPQGFSKRMIMPSLYGRGESEPTQSVKDSICDLRHIVNKMLGRKGTGTNDTGVIIDACRHNMGQWCEVDGGSIKIKVYKVGTVHLEVHPDIAWRLNKILAVLYPMAIPSKFKKAQKYASKQVVVKHNLISRGAVFHLGRMKKALGRIAGRPEWARDREYLADTYKFDIDLAGIAKSGVKEILDEASDVLVACGVVRVENEFTPYAFKAPTKNFDFGALISELVSTGYVPEVKSHQFYPTQDELADEAVQWCEIDDGHTKLEPSAGQGHLALKMGADVTCVELSAVSCAVLSAKGLNAVESDFIAWAQTAGTYDRIVMNPPFSEGRAIEHFNAAASCLADGGILVAILPSSVKGKLSVDGASIEYSRVIDDAFKAVGTNVSVIMVKVVK